MVVKAKNAFDLSDDGIIFQDDDSNQVLWIGGGVAVPNFTLPCPGHYIRTNGDNYFNVDGLPGSWVLQTISGPATDHHSAIDCVLDGETLTIEEKKQMVVFRHFKLEGCLVLKGSLILKEG